MALPRSGCLRTSRNGTPDDQAGHRSGRAGSRRLPEAGEVPGQHQHRRDLGELRRLADLVARRSTSQLLLLAAVPAPVPTASMSSRRTMPKPYSRRRQPLQERGETLEDTTATATTPIADPDELAEPHAGGLGRHVGLPGRVEHEQAERDEQAASP